MSFLKRPVGLPLFQQRVAIAVAPIVDVINKGIVVDSAHVVGERLPDGRVRLKLAPAIAQQLGLL